MFLGTNDLIQELPSIVVENFDPKCIKNACYNLRLGNEVYITNAANKKKEILDDKNSQAVIEPGQFALLITKETVLMPDKRIGFITLRFSQKIKGLINVSGFHVDPGFHGKIVFSVYNAGPTTIHLDKDKEYFSIWLAELKQSSGNVKSQFQDQKSISEQYIDSLGGTLASPNALLQKTVDLDNKIQEVNQSFKERQTHLDWKRNLVIGLLIAIALKLFWDWGWYRLGFEDGKNYKIETERVHTVINSKTTDSLIYIRINKVIDSVQKQK
jgi:dCTP deaminase